MAQRLLVGTPDSPIPIGPSILDHLRADRSDLNLRLAFAYASRSGLNTLLSSAGASEEVLRGVASEWIVGIDRGITEPRVLENILDLPSARLRIFCPSGNLAQAALTARPRLHAKVIALSSRNNSLMTLASSSANLTGAALGPQTLNYEVGFCATERDSISTLESDAFNEWWTEIRNNSIPATKAIINNYAKLRGEFLRRSPDLTINLDPPLAEDIAGAKFLWIHTGAMMGSPQTPEYHHQIEFAQDLARFFRAPRRNIEVLIQIGNNAPISRPLTFRGTRLGQFVEIWRLGLPTLLMGGTVYRHRVVRFERIEDDGTIIYLLEVDDLDSPRARRWRREANRRGYIGRTGLPGAPHGREYGFYS